MHKLSTVLTLAVLVTACHDQPTAVNEAGTGPTVLAMQTMSPADTMPPGSGWTLLFYEDVSDPATSPWVFEMPCLGAGNSVQFVRWWWWSKDFVTTPSGSVHATQRVTWNGGGYRAPNGDIWALEKMNQPLIANWQWQGAEWVAENPGQAWYVNTRTGQRMVETSAFVLRFPVMPPPVPTYTGFDVMHYGCHLMGPE